MNLKIRFGIGVILMVASIVYLVFVALVTQWIVQLYGDTYLVMYYLPKILPVMLIGFYFLSSSEPKLEKILVWFSYVCLAVSAVVGAIWFFAFITNMPFSLFFSDWSWSYEAVFEWAFCFALVWLLVKRKTANLPLALTFAALAISAGGNLHEMQFGFFNIDTYFHFTYPLLLNTQIVSLIFLMVLLWENHWKPTRLFYAATAIFIAFTILYGTIFNPNVNGIHFQNLWLPRLPTIFLLVSLPFGLKKNAAT